MLTACLETNDHTFATFEGRNDAHFLETWRPPKRTDGKLLNGSSWGVIIFMRRRGKGLKRINKALGDVLENLNASTILDIEKVNAR